MTSKAQITKVASREGVDARVVERDYVLAHIVALISANDSEKRLIFKGGTSLRLLHVEDYRYSADLDYSVINGTEADGREVIRAALDRSRPDTIKSLSLDDTADRISYVGPLGAMRTIKLDLADDELVVNTAERPLLKRWTDLPEVLVAAYTTLEIAAEKLRCVLQRLQCRDFLDLDLLLADEDPTDAVELFRRKASHKGLDPDSFAMKFEKRVKEYEKRWEQELGEYLGEVPHFDQVERNVRRGLRGCQLL